MHISYEKSFLKHQFKLNELVGDTFNSTSDVNCSNENVTKS